MREEPSPLQEKLEDSEKDDEQLEGQLGGKGSRLSASHVIARSKLYPEGGRLLSKSTSRMGEVAADNTVTFSNEKEVVAEYPPTIIESEGMPVTVQLHSYMKNTIATLVHSESRSGYAPISVGEVCW